MQGWTLGKDYNDVSIFIGIRHMTLRTASILLNIILEECIFFQICIYIIIAIISVLVQRKLLRTEQHLLPHQHHHRHCSHSGRVCSGTYINPTYRNWYQFYSQIHQKCEKNEHGHMVITPMLVYNCMHNSTGSQNSNTNQQRDTFLKMHNLAIFFMIWVKGRSFPIYNIYLVQNWSLLSIYQRHIDIQLFVFI